MNIIKLNFDSLKIKDLEMVAFSSDKIVLKTSLRTMDIYYSNLNDNQRQEIKTEFENIRLKNNLPNQTDKLNA